MNPQGPNLHLEHWKYGKLKYVLPAFNSELKELSFEASKIEIRPQSTLFELRPSNLNEIKIRDKIVNF